MSMKARGQSAARAASSRRPSPGFPLAGQTTRVPSITHADPDAVHARPHRRHHRWSRRCGHRRGDGRTGGGLTANALSAGLRALGLDADAGLLTAYVDELDRWNGVYGFVKADREQLVSRHVLDALAGVPLVRALGPAVADFGSGAGLPAIPLAIALPGMTFTLIERSEKRRAFLAAVAAHVGLRNACVVAQARGDRFDLVTARAVAPLPELAGTVARQRLAPRLLVYAGTRATIDTALRALPYPAVVERVRVPGLAAERHLVTVDLAGGRTPP